jgi:hypothetical protein
LLEDELGVDQVVVLLLLFEDGLVVEEGVFVGVVEEL